MIKKGTKRKSSTAKTSSTTKIDKKLAENFVALQKVMVNQASKFDILSDKISNLLELFEISAKALIEKEHELGQNKGDKEIIKKLDEITNQNKTLAKGMTLMHEAAINPNVGYSLAKTEPRPNPTSVNAIEKTQNIGEYQKSITSETPKFNKLPKI